MTHSLKFHFHQRNERLLVQDVSDVEKIKAAIELVDPNASVEWETDTYVSIGDDPTEYESRGKALIHWLTKTGKCKDGAIEEILTPLFNQDHEVKFVLSSRENDILPGSDTDRTVIFPDNVEDLIQQLHMKPYLHELPWFCTVLQRTLIHDIRTMFIEAKAQS